jgi:hypothetical protein
MLRIGYGQSSFETLIKDGCYYADRTNYLPKLEDLGAKYFFYLRPRRFGKSLVISMLEYYYDIFHADKFETLFGKLAVGSTPTPLKNSYLILRFDFSGIDTTTIERTEQMFVEKIKLGVSTFRNKYKDLYSKEEEDYWLETNRAEVVMGRLFNTVIFSTQKIYLLIDEYDHFTNELVSFNLEGFKESVSRNGFVRKFYETIKTAAGNSIVDRLFVTGVSPVTLDSMTSGFNISTSLTLDADFHNFMGFTEAEVADILRGIEVSETDMPKLIRAMKKWYNGYLFSTKAPESVYNPDMVLYFAHYYARYREYPEEMLDMNIASDYSKIRKIFRIGGFENNKLATLERLIKGERVLVQLTSQFSFEKAGFPTEDMISLLFYMGFLTIKKKWGDKYEMVMPNKVIRDIYFQYFLQVMEEKAQTNRDLYDLSNALDELIWENKPKAICEILEEALDNLSKRDYQGMDEKHIQAMFYAYLNLSKMYEVKSEYEENRKHFDILMLETPIAEAKYEFIFEFKYEKKAGEKRTSTVLSEAREQMLGYLALQNIRQHPKMKAWVIVVVGTVVAECVEVIL